MITNMWRGEEVIYLVVECGRRFCPTNNVEVMLHMHLNFFVRPLVSFRSFFLTTGTLITTVPYLFYFRANLKPAWTMPLLPYRHTLPVSANKMPRSQGGLHYFTAAAQLIPETE